MRLLTKTKSDTITINLQGDTVKGIPNTRNVIKQPDGYYLRKYINGKHTYLGFGTTLIIALMKLDWCKANGWKKYPQKYKYILKTRCGYVIRKWNGEEMENLGLFKTYEEAKHERDLLIQYNWDLELLCETLDERTNNKTIFLNEEMYDGKIQKDV